jgi:2Fe-2S ferredoxin
VAEGRRLFVVGRAEPIVVEEKEDFLDALQRAGVPIRTSCGGVATCGLCRLTVVEGSKNLTPFKGQEQLHLGNVAPIVGLRLACQTRFACEADVRVSVPPVDDVHARKRRKIERFREAAGKSSKSANSVTVPPPRTERLPRVEWRPRILEAGAADPVRLVGSVSTAPPRASQAPAPPPPRAPTKKPPAR